MTSETDYPGKIKNLMEELRVAREKIITLDERVKREEKTAIQAQERMIQLEEKCRELKNKLRAAMQQRSTSDTVSESTAIVS